MVPVPARFLANDNLATIADAVEEKRAVTVALAFDPAGIYRQEGTAEPGTGGPTAAATPAASRPLSRAPADVGSSGPR
jgi:hypothetical protein